MIKRLKLDNITPSKVFLILSFLFGVLLVFITPPFQVPDEPAHFYRAYQLSEFTLVGLKKNNKAGGYIPKSIVSMTNDLIGDVPPPPRYRVSIYTILHYLHRQKNVTELEFIDFRNTVLYSPIVYLPQSFGLIIAKLLHLPPLWLLYFGRMGNLIAFIIIMYLAIKIIPIYKWGIVLLALMPMTLFLASSLSADSITIAISFLLISYIMRCSVRDKEILIKNDILIISFLSFIIGLCKFSYILLPLLFFIIPFKKFSTKLYYVKSMVLIFISTVLGFLIWSMFVRNLFLPQIDYVNPQNQLIYIFTHPISFFMIFIRSINDFGLLYSFVGNLCWLEKPLPYGVVLLYLLFIVFVAVFEKRDFSLTLNMIQKSLVFSILFLLVFVIALSLYLTWNDIGSTYIYGPSGRYFIPFSPLIYFLLLTKKFQFEKSETFFKIVLPVFLMITLIITIYSAFEGHYIFYYH